MLPYNTLAPLLGQATIRARREGIVYQVVAHRDGSKPRVVKQHGATHEECVIVDHITGADISDAALRGAWYRSPEDSRAILTHLRRATRRDDGGALPAQDIAAALWLMACSLSTLDRIDREERAKLEA